LDDIDITPPATPTVEQQRDALKKGLGRAVTWATSGKLDPEVLLEACLHDQRYDWQCEAARGSWLWSLMRAGSVADRFRQPIFDEFAELPEVLAVQLCGLARHYAASGDTEFRERLYGIVGTRPIPSMDSLGESELVELDGEKGFIFAAGVRGDLLDSDRWGWSHRSLVDDAVERWGRERTIRLLEESDRHGCGRFLSAWIGSTEELSTGGVEAYHLRMRTIPVTDVLAAASNKDRCIWFRGWGTQAGEDDLRTVFAAIREEADTHRLARLLRVFHGRVLPEIVPRILELVRHPDADVSGPAVKALKPASHPAIRKLALELLTQMDTVESAVSLLIHNYVADDEGRILTTVSALQDEDDLHRSLMSARHVLMENVEADPVSLGLFIYRHTPCGECRESTAALLHERGAMPEWMRAELRLDANEHCRELVETIDGGEEKAIK
jgi:hypothetical protein